MRALKPGTTVKSAKRLRLAFLLPARACLSVVGTGLRLAVIWFYPHSGPDEAFLARLKWWEENAASLQKGHRLQSPAFGSGF